MIRFILVISIVCFPFQLNFAMAPRLNWQQAIDKAIIKFGLLTEPSLKRAFKRAGVSYPPKEIALLTFKKERKIELWATDSVGTKWHHIKNYKLTAFSGSLGPKLKEHDRQIPEGIYQLVSFNPFSSYHLSLMINYPNDFDKYHGRLDGRYRLGNNIFLHGKNISVGCLAIGNYNISQLFTLSRRVGLNHIQLIIAPNDLRKHKAYTKMASQPKWLPELYRDIKRSLKRFKEPKVKT